uniref:Uncharacterized protein n=1 Tax=Rhizophora mucronata TaxID=61149 RepID=A0A2P2JDJ3_RHIMU
MGSISIQAIGILCNGGHPTTISQLKPMLNQGDQNPYYIIPSIHKHKACHLGCQ